MNRLLSQAFDCQQAGDLSTASAICSVVLSQEAGNAEALHLKGVLLHQTGSTSEAITFLERALSAHPTNAGYWSNLGLVYQAAGRLADAMGALRKALACDPNLAEARANLASVLNLREDYAAAEAECREAIRLRPQFAAAWNNLGVALGGQDRLDEAIASYRRAIELSPQSVDPLRNLGHVLRERGQFDEARRHYEAVVRLNPRETKACHSLSLTHRYSTADQPEIDCLETRLLAGGLTPDEQADLHFALGKIYDDCALYDRAFEHFRQGNQAVRPAFDRQEAAARIEAMIEAFCPARVAAAHGDGHPSDRPVFIVGMPRSGTTLVEQILSTSDEVAACGEVLDIDRIARQLEAQSTPDSPWPSRLLALGGRELRALGDGYLERRLARRPQALRTTDKLPANFLWLGLIGRIFPRARIIHCRRDPLDVCLSCYTIDFSMRPAFAYDLEDLGFFHRLYRRLMAHWQSVLPLRILDVDYEQLVADPEPAARRIVEFCGLPWRDTFLRPQENRRPVRTSSGWQVRQPIYTSAVGRWRHYEPHLAPLRRALAEL